MCRRLEKFDNNYYMHFIYIIYIRVSLTAIKVTTLLLLFTCIVIPINI